MQLQPSVFVFCMFPLKCSQHTVQLLNCNLLKGTRIRFFRAALWHSTYCCHCQTVLLLKLPSCLHILRFLNDREGIGERKEEERTCWFFFCGEKPNPSPQPFLVQQKQLIHFSCYLFLHPVLQWKLLQSNQQLPSTVLRAGTL